MRYSIAALFLVLGLAACQRNNNADQANAQIVAAAEAAAQAAQAAADAAETASRNAEAAAQAAETAGSTAEAAAAPAPAAAPAEPAAAAGEAAAPAAEGGEAASGGAAAAPAEGGEAATPAAGGEAAAGDAAAGKALFTGKLGCYGCHGQAGGGGMGPSLADKTWIYGGTYADLSETLHNGRPGGMPAFGGQASEQEINDVIAYVVSLGGAPAGAAAPADGEAASVPAGGDGQNAAAEGDEAQNAAPEDGGDSPQAEGGDAHAATGTDEQIAAAQSGPIEGAQPPDNTPVTGDQAGGSSLDYATAGVGTGTGYTHPNGIGADWADDGTAEPVEGPPAPEEAEGDEAQNAAPEDGGDSPQAEGGDAHAATGTDEQVAAAQSAPITGSVPPDNSPVTGDQAGGSSLDYATAGVGTGEGYTHPNGIGSDWADDGTAAPVEGAPAEGNDDQSAAPAAEGEAASVPAGGDGQNAAAEGDEAQNAAPEDGGDSPQAAAAPAAGGAAAAGGEAATGDAAAGKALFTGKLGCYGCHGQAGGGGMGPSLADKTWIYGGTYADLSETLHNGRPGGMPAFGSQASEQEINDVIAYVQSLGGAPADSGGGAAAPADGEAASVPAGGDGQNAAAEGDEAQNAAPEDGGDSHAATGTPEQIAAAQSGPIEGAQPPDNSPVTGNQAGGSSLDYATAGVGTGEGYTHPNGIGADWADDGTAEPVEGPPAAEEAQGDEAQNAAPEDGGDSPQAEAAPAGPITGSVPPDNSPVTGDQAGGSSLDYATAGVGTGEGYTHPNGIGSDWADDGTAAPVEGAPAEGNDDQSAAPAAEGEAASVPAGGDGQNAAAEGDEAQNAAPEDGGDSPQAAAAPAQSQTAAIEGSQPPDNTPVTDAASSSLDYATAGVGTGTGYTHPNGIGADWADDGTAEPVEGPPAAEEAQGDEAQNAAPEDGGDSPQAEAAPAGPITGSVPPDNSPVTGDQAGGSSLDYDTANVGQGEGYTHPNGFGSEWVAANQTSN